MATTASVQPDHNSLGKASFIIGLIGLVLSFIPFVGFVSWLLAPLAIVFGLIALRRRNRSLAIAGIVTGVIALFVCFAWAKAAGAAGEAFNRDTFNTTGATQDNAAAPVMDATVKGVWRDIEGNKVAAGQKYGAHRLHFTGERIADFGGDAAAPTISFVGKSEQFMDQLVAASFSAADGKAITGLKKGGKVGFTCNNISETIGEGYSLAGCVLDK